MKRILLVLAAVLVLAVAAGAVLWHMKTHEVKKKTGSPTVQFTPKEKPGVVKRPKKVLVETPWLTYGYDIARSHYAEPFHVRPPFRPRWVVNARYYVEFPPAVAYGKVYVAQLKGKFFAINANTGTVAWKKSFDNYCTAASPTVAKGVVYQPYLPSPCNYGSRDSTTPLIAMDAKTGKVLWQRRGPPSESSTLYLDGVLYYGNWAGDVIALDTKTRKVRWTTHLDSEIDSSPAYHGGRIFIGTNGGHVYALRPRDGRVLWEAGSYSHFPHGREYFYATPTVAYGRVFIGNTDGTLYAYGERTGDLLWAQPAGTYVYSAAAVWSRTVYVGTYDGYFKAFDAATGDLRWSFSAPAAVHGAPTVMDGLVYFSTCSNCGHLGSRYAKAGPAVTIALDARTGKRVWSFPDGRYSAIVADSKRAYLTGTGRIYALDPCATRKSSALRRHRLRRC